VQIYEYYSFFYDICCIQTYNKFFKMGMNKNTVLGWATFIMLIMGFVLIALGAFRYDDIAGWGFAAVGIGFLANAWVFNALKGRV
jgi:hypothetical protein